MCTYTILVNFVKQIWPYLVSAANNIIRMYIVKCIVINKKLVKNVVKSIQKYIY